MIMGYCPGITDSVWETNRNQDYYENNREKFEEMKRLFKKHMEETNQLAADFEESTKEQQRMQKLINELRKTKTSSLDMLLLLKIVMTDDLADFDLVSDQVIAVAKEKYPEGNFDDVMVDDDIEHDYESDEYSECNDEDDDSYDKNDEDEDSEDNENSIAHHARKELFEIWLEGAAWMYYALMTKRPQTAYKTGQLTLESAIKHCEDVLPLCENDEVREEHIQLRDWLKELKELREWSNKKPNKTKKELK